MSNSHSLLCLGCTWLLSEDSVVWKFDEKWKAVWEKQQTDKWVRFEGNERRVVADGPEEDQILIHNAHYIEHHTIEHWTDFNKH